MYTASIQALPCCFVRNLTPFFSLFPEQDATIFRMYAEDSEWGVFERIAGALGRPSSRVRDRYIRTLLPQEIRSGTGTSTDTDVSR